MLMLESQFFELISHIVYSDHKRAQWIFKHKYLLDWSNIKISSYFSFWEPDYFFGMAFLRNSFDNRKILDGKPFMFFFLNPANHIELSSVISKSDVKPGCILLNINRIPIRETPTKAFPVWVFYATEKVCVLKA